MPNILNERTLLLALLSMTRSRLMLERPFDAMPLAGMIPDVFAQTPWNELDLSLAGQEILLGELSLMFPPPVGFEFNAIHETPGAMSQAVFNGWLAGDRQIVYQSSGSSGLPKSLPHSSEALQQEIDCLAGFFPQVRHIVVVTPQHHAYGFTFGILMHARLGVPYTVLPPLPTIIRHALSPGGQLSCITGQILLVGYPGLWLRFHEPYFSPPDNLICLSAGSPWSDESMSQFYLAGYRNLLEIYGSSENGAVGYRRGSENPGDFCLLDYWIRKLPDAEDKNGHALLLRRLPSSKLMSMPLQDEFSWSSERTFRPLKRRDGAVQVSGINVYPSHTAEVIARHPQVLACRVRLMRPEEGHRLKAFVVPQPGAILKTLRRELKSLCKQELASPGRPARLTFGPAVPTNDFGKEVDWK